MNSHMNLRKTIFLNCRIELDNYFIIQLSFISASIFTSWVRTYFGFHYEILIYAITQLFISLKTRYSSLIAKKIFRIIGRWTHTHTDTQTRTWWKCHLNAMKMLIKSRRGYQETVHYKLFWKSWHLKSLNDWSR